MTNPKLCGQFAVRLFAGSHRNNVLLGELGMQMFAARLPAARYSISSIVGVSADPQMIRVYTSGVIA